MFGMIREYLEDRKRIKEINEQNEKSARKQVKDSEGRIEVLEKELAFKQEALDKNLGGLGRNIDDLLASLEPILLERGRRVFGNLKQSKPKTVLVEVENLPYDATMVLSPAPGGHLIRAYVVESIVDIRCLSMALSYSKTEPCRDYLSTGIDVVINGIPVIPAEDVKGKS